MTKFQCKICWDTSPLQHLISPCACTGTMRFVHSNCLIEWLHQKGDVTSCEICKAPLSVTLPLHKDITFVILCTWIYIFVIVYVPFFYTYFMSAGSLDISA